MPKLKSFIGSIFRGKGHNRYASTLGPRDGMNDRLERLKRSAAGAPPAPPRYTSSAPSLAPSPEPTRAYAPEPDEAPFGEDISNPDARELPVHFQGEWTRDPNDYDTSRRTILGAGRMVVDGSVEEDVIAVRFIDPDNIAVVGLPVDDTGRNYTLRYFGISEDRSRLTDLESADCVLQRWPAQGAD